MTHYPEDLTLNQEDKMFAHYIIPIRFPFWCCRVSNRFRLLNEAMLGFSKNFPPPCKIFG